MGTDIGLIPVLTVAPTRRELGGLGHGNERTRASVIGVGRSAGAQTAALLHEAPCRLLVSLGYAGALEPRLHTGDLVVGDGFLHGVDAPVAGSPQAARAALALRESGLSVREGPVLTVDEPLLSPRAKRRAHSGSGALVVDMEGWWIAEAARSTGVPMIGVRAVVDQASYSLPSFVAAIVADAGRHEWAHTFRAMSRPSVLGSLLPLALKSRKASRALHDAILIVLASLVRQP